MKKLDLLWLDPYVKAFIERMTYKHLTGYNILEFLFGSHIRSI